MTLRRPLRWRAATVVGMLSLLSGGAFPAWAAIDLSGIRLPPGFRIELFSDRVPDARSMTLAEEGTVYVGSLAKGRVYARKDGDGDGFAEQVRIVASGLDYPNGVAWWQGSLYIAEVSRLLRLKDPSAAVEAQPEVVYEGFPGDKHHGWKYLRVGPDDKLYTAVGAPCNVCQPSRPIYGTLLRMDLDGSHLEILARGVRNSVGFDFHPETRELWFTDNGRDWLGDDRPPMSSIVWVPRVLTTVFPSASVRRSPIRSSASSSPAVKRWRRSGAFRPMWRPWVPAS
jgi:glucose/arabinose dehydrogenase